NRLHAEMVDRQAVLPDTVSTSPASLQAGGALSCVATRKCALLTSIASLFRASGVALRQALCDPIEVAIVTPNAQDFKNQDNSVWRPCLHRLGYHSNGSEKRWQ
ncbi:hypothetical protein, partial [Antarcticirhabdus aurantiaca]|uniref:hypothetical protein n=1 Tax=Antarcticirhabdus aurantiaca TaxID=2606717 RepID=UPI001AEED482